MKTKRMRRNGFLRSWSGVVALALLALYVGISLAGAAGRHYQVAVLTPGKPFGPVLEGLRDELARLGYVPGKNVTLVVEDTSGAVPDLVQRAAKLVAAKPDVLVTLTTAHTAAAKQATDQVPIVFSRVGDPVRSGLIASYASSQNNLTGISNYSVALAGKRLELLQEIAPGLKRVLAVVAAQESITEIAFQALAETAQKLGIEVLRRNVTTPEEIEAVLRETTTGSVHAIFHIPSALVGAHIELLIQKAQQEKIPLIVHEDSMVDQGALVSYGVNVRLIGVQTAKIVAKILKGTRPSELPIQTPEKLLLAINLTTAQAIGLDVPRSVLERADRLVE